MASSVAFQRRPYCLPVSLKVQVQMVRAFCGVRELLEPEIAPWMQEFIYALRYALRNCSRVLAWAAGAATAASMAAANRYFFIGFLSER